MNDTTEHQHDAQIDRYLKARMSADEKAQFEIRMLEEPELLERVQLLDALELELGAEEELLLAGDNTGDAVKVTGNVLPFKAWVRQPLSLAASVLVAVLVAYNVYDVSPATDSFTAVPVRSLILLDGSRGDTPTPVSGAGPWLVQIDAGLDAQSANFGISVISESNQQILIEETGLTADGNGWVRLLLDDLPAGDYRVTLDWQDAQGATLNRSYLVRFGGQ
jgi:hypothetical protein